MSDTKRLKTSTVRSSLEVKATAKIAQWVADNPNTVSYFTNKRAFTDLEITFDLTDKPTLYAHRVDLVRGSKYFKSSIDVASKQTLDMSHRGFDEVLFVLNLLELSHSDQDLIDVSFKNLDLFAALEFVNGYYIISWLDLRLNSVFTNHDSLYNTPVNDLVSFIQLWLESGIAYRWITLEKNFINGSKVSMQFWMQLFPVAYEFKHEYLFKSCLNALAVYFKVDIDEFQETIEEHADQIKNWSDFMLLQLAKRQMLLRFKGRRFFSECLNTLRATPFEIDPWD